MSASSRCRPSGSSLNLDSACRSREFPERPSSGRHTCGCSERRKRRQAGRSVGTSPKKPGEAADRRSSWNTARLARPSRITRLRYSGSLRFTSSTLSAISAGSSSTSSTGRESCMTDGPSPKSRELPQGVIENGRRGTRRRRDLRSLVPTLPTVPRRLAYCKSTNGATLRHRFYKPLQLLAIISCGKLSTGCGFRVNR